jgi:DNA-binding NarL/FixJ family response regulator
MTTGLFHSNRNPAASYSNRQRKPKEHAAQRKSRAEYFRKRRAAKPKKLTKRDQVAELLSEELSIEAIAERMGLTDKAVRRHLEKIRAGLGPQAV